MISLVISLVVAEQHSSSCARSITMGGAEAGSMEAEGEVGMALGPERGERARGSLPRENCENSIGSQ